MTNDAPLAVPLSHSLNTRVTVFALAVFVLSIWSLSFYLSRSLRADMEHLLGEQQFSVVTAVAKEVNDNLIDRRQALESISGQMDAVLMRDPKALQAFMEQRHLLPLLFNAGAWVAGTDGTAIASLPQSANRLGVNYMDRDFMVTSLKEGKAAIGKPVMGRQLKSPVFAMSVPVRDAQGTVIGVIVGATDLGKPSFLDKITQNSYGKAGGYLLVSPQARQIITATDKRRIMEVLPSAGVNPFVDRNIAGYEGHSLLVNALGEQQLASVKRVPAADWYVLLGSPATEVFAPLKDLQQRLVWATLFFTLLTGGLTWLVLRRQLAPVLEAAHAMVALSDSDQLPQPLHTTHKGEIGQLVAGFNRILQTWALREESLKASESFKDVILNSLDAEIAVVDRHGVIQAVNARWQQFSLANSAKPGETAQNTGIGAHYLAVCRVDTGEEEGGGVMAHAGLQAVLEGRLPRFTCEYPCDTPTQQRWFAMMAMPLGAHGQGGAVISHTDITPRKQAEQAMHRMKTMMEQAEGMAQLGSFQWDVHTDTTTWSPELFRFFKLDPALGTPNLEGQARLYTPASLKLLYEAVDKALTHGMAYVLELTAMRADGEERPCIVKAFPQRDASGRVAHLVGLVQDITDIRRKDEQLRLAASVFTHAREGITITNSDGTIIDVNEAFTRITGYSREEVLGQNPRILKSGRQDAAFYADMWQSLNEAGHWSGEIWNRRKNGEVYAELLTISAVRDERGDARHYMALFADITAIKEHQNQLEHIAHFDALTHLPNRLLLADRLQQAMAQTQRRGKQLAVVYLDLDGFKAVNDQHGHDAGDQLLISLASAMKDTLREGDTLARIGGDEFVAVLSDLDSVEICQHMLTRLLGAASAPVNLGAVTLRCSASLGATFYPQAQNIEPDQLLRQADQAMYQAKMAGKNRYRLFDAAQDSNLRAHNESLQRIQLALARDEFVLYYQPKVNMRNGQVVGAEALIRWQHPEQGLLLPDAFLPNIEDHPLALAVGEWVLETALAQMDAWRATRLELAVSVNISAIQLQQADFVPRLQAILALHPHVNPAALELEVLETSALADIAQVSAVIEACIRIGVKFALDDFGTGYSSLTYLKQLHVATLKMDQSFVRDMLQDPDDCAILQGVIGLASAFRREVIAEGVETLAHGTALLQMGCDLAQGFGIARPMPADSLPGWIAQWHTQAKWTA